MTLFVSLVVIVLVAAVVGRVCSRSRPGSRRAGGEGIVLPDTGHHSGWAHSHNGHHHDGAWGGDSGGPDSSGGGGGD